MSETKSVVSGHVEYLQQQVEAARNAMERVSQGSKSHKYWSERCDRLETQLAYIVTRRMLK